MVKTIVILMVLAAAVIGGVWYMSKGFDPTKEGLEKKAKIAPGMTWKQVLDAAGAPQKYDVYRKTKKKVAGEDVEVTEEGTPLSFDPTLFENSFKANEMPLGFHWSYKFSMQAAYGVSFNPAGSVVAVVDEKTEADLYGTRK